MNTPNNQPAAGEWDFLKVSLAAPKKAEVTVYDRIGPADWTGKGVDAAEVKKKLDAMGDLEEISIRINSPGGNAFHGLAIYNILKSHKAKKIVSVDGVAASAASLIAMAGDEIVMNEGSLMMIHEASIMSWGQKKELEQAIKLLDAINESAVKLYHRKTGMAESDLRDLLSAETWMTDTEAVSKKFADRINTNTKAVAATLDPQQLATAPAWVQARFADAPGAQIQKEPGMTATTPNTTTAPAQQAANSAPDTQAKPEGDSQTPSTSQTPALAAAKPAEPAPATPTPAVDLLAQERERSSKIVALCSQAGRPDLAAGFIENPAMSVDLVTGQLFNVMCQAAPPVGDAGGSQKPADPSAAFKKEYAQHKETLVDLGVSEDEYVQSRMVDEGLSKLVPAGK